MVGWLFNEAAAAQERWIALIGPAHVELELPPVRTDQCGGCPG
jgi:hypothetical protein